MLICYVLVLASSKIKSKKKGIQLRGCDENKIETQLRLQ